MNTLQYCRIYKWLLNKLCAKQIQVKYGLHIKIYNDKMGLL